MNPTWILMFYSMPSKPERNRLRIYRRLQKEGTLSLKDGVHLLPYSDDRYELFQWLAQEIKTLDGEMHFVTIEKIEGLENSDIVALFKKQAENSYAQIEERIALFSLDKDKEHESRSIFKKIIRDFESLYTIDFFHSFKGERLKQSIQAIQSSFETIIKKSLVSQCNRADFQKKIWQTRPKPFVDRMASAWLIRTFIDPEAQFVFAPMIDETKKNVITYDMDRATFTHIGDLCTFEVLVQVFSIEDTKVHYMAKIIHNLDLNDEKYLTPEADGIKLILSAIRSNGVDDIDILKKSDEIFDYLYQTLK
ncbi:MAG TPA: chromate resistance protein ChrB domain-containing protein [Sulfuricurvum sp.]|nr:chromate resistance protein ChrB domain-containing protein [Sulfuricurvum sp.]